MIISSDPTPAERPIRVAHLGTGVIGTEVIKGIVNHSDLELVGMWVTSPGKVGKDAADLAGIAAPTGIRAVNSLDEASAAKPDILTYCDNGIGREHDAANEIARTLASGVDVVTISLLNMLYPPAGPADLWECLNRAAAAGNSTFLCTGIDPGFCSDVLPLALLTMSDEIEHIRMQEIAIYDHYDVEHRPAGDGIRASALI